MLTLKNSRFFAQIIAIVLASWQILISTSVQAQNEKNLGVITVNYKNTPLHEVLEDLSQKCKVEFSYSSNTIPADLEISYKATDKTANEVILEICKIAGIEYDEVGGYLVLKKVLEQQKTIEVVKPEKHTLSGYIVDAENQEALIGATLYEVATGHGTITNSYGFFSFTLPEGNYTINTSYLGYDLSSREIDLKTDMKWNIELVQSVSQLEEVVITSLNREQNILYSLAAQNNISPFEVQYYAAALGETDMLKSLDRLPGINFLSDGSSYFYVRGGNRDQNLILLDEATIYNPSHMLGLFSPIIPEAVKQTTVYKGDFPVQYGGRLSSLIDIRTRDGNMKKFSGSTSIGTVSARVSLEGPLKKEVSSYFISFRRSYLGAFVKAVNHDIKKFYFTDFTAKFNIRLRKKDRLFLTFYSGKDLYLAMENTGIKNGLEWGNKTFTARWNHLFGDRLFLNTTFYASKYDYFLHTNYDEELHWNSHISSGHLKSEFSYYVNPQMKWLFGLQLGHYYFNPGNSNQPNISDNLVVSQVNSGEAMTYVGNEVKISNKIILNAGIRLSRWNNSGEAFVVSYENYKPTGTVSYAKKERYFLYSAWEPRISISYKTSQLSSVKASYNRTLQHINLINNSISPFNSLEVWLPSGPNIKPQKADIYNLGFVKMWSRITVDLTIDVFYKNLYNQIGFANHAKTILNPYIEGELRQGDGLAYGFEVSVKKSTGRFTGQFGYSFTRSLLRIESLNNGETYQTRQDKPIDLSFELGYFIKPRWLASANFMYSSGSKITTPTAFYEYRGTQVPLYTSENNQRLPDYKRIDISSDFKLNKSEGSFEHHLVVSIFNLFNYKNPAFLYFTKTEDAEGNLIVPSDKLNSYPQTPSSRNIYSIIPSITYTLNF